MRCRLAGADPRVALREQAELSEEDRRRRRRAAGPLGRRPGERPVDPGGAAADRRSGPACGRPTSPPRSGRETLPFKRDVRKLKELGLTRSLPVGYEISPRGRAYLG